MQKAVNRKVTFGIPPPLLLIQPCFQLPLITSRFDATPSFILNDHTYAGVEDVDKVSSSPDGGAIHSEGA
jgi:hypothetical protein